MDKDNKPRRFYTDAPTDYDWGWTTTLVENAATITHNGRPLRLVEIDDEYHATSQVARYQSGLHVGLDQAAFDDWCRHGQLTPTPAAEVHHHRKIIDLGDVIYDRGRMDLMRSYYDRYHDGAGPVVFKPHGSGGHRFLLAVRGPKDEAKATFDRIVREIEAIMKMGAE